MLIKNGMVDLFKQSVTILAVKFIRTLVPGAVFLHERALFGKIIKALGRSPEVLLPMGVVAVRPLVFLVYVRTECGFVEERHETLYLAFLVVGVQLVTESLLLDQFPHQIALFCICSITIKYLLNGRGYIFYSSSFITVTYSTSI